MDCNCPASTALTEIETQDCPFNLTQIQKLGFQRGGTAFESASAIGILSNWQALKTATDETKIVITPLIGGDPVIESGEAITTGGGDNSTLNGVEEIEGVNPSTFSAMFKSLSPAIESQIKKLMCEQNLVVYFFLQGGKIAYAKELTGFEIQSFFLSDRNNAGYGQKDTFTCRFSMPAGWSEKLEIVKPDFNPLTEL